MECPFFEIKPTLFIFSSSDYLPRLLYYAHIPTLFLFLFIGFFVYIKSRKQLSGKILLMISTFYSLWILFSLVNWVNYESNLVMFLWSFSDFLFLLIYILSFYFVYVYVKEKDLNIKTKIFLLSLSFPTFLMSLLGKNIKSFNFLECVADDNFFPSVYVYSVSFVITIAILIFCLVSSYLNKIKKRKIFILTLGIAGFLVPFLFFETMATFLAVLGFDSSYFWELYGLFGVPLFITSLIYLIVRHKAFNIKLHESKALVVGLFILIASQLFYIKNSTDVIIAIITLIISFFFGILLIRSIIHRDRKKRLELEKINKELNTYREHLELVNRKLEQDKKIVEAANRELLNLDTAKTEFINIASHQLRTPVTVIKGIAALSLAGHMERFGKEDQRQFSQVLWNKSRKLENIINDILSAASLTNRKYVVSQERCDEIDLKKLLQRVVRDFEVELAEKKIELLLKAEADFPPIKGQEEDLEDAFGNLINNAIKYTISDAEKRGKVMVTISLENSHLLVSIKDNGIGIPRAEIPKLFQKFYRAENAKQAYTDGSGLGLFIVKEIIEGHGGKVWVESELGKGTVFYIKLPILAKNEQNKKEEL